MKGTKIFISHSTFDKSIAEALVNFLVSGIGIEEKMLFCSSVSGHDIPVGLNFNDYIIKQLKGYNATTISIISNNYYNSKYCLYELGAAWGLCKNKIIPILVNNMKYGNLQDFISHNQAVTIDKIEDINKLADYFRNKRIYKKRKISQTKYESERTELLEKVQKIKREKLSFENFNKVQIKQNHFQFKYKLVVFDFDGTILQGENFKHSWKEVWKFLGYDDAIRKELYENHRSYHKEYKFQDWCDECGNYFIKAKFKREHVTQIIESRKLKIADGFNVMITLLKEVGIRSIFISGGIDTFIHETVSESTLKLMDEIFVNKFIYNKEGFLTGIKAYQNDDSDSVGKTKTLEKYCEEKGIDLEEVVFVGDEVNDLDIASHVGLAFVYPAADASKYVKELHYPIYDSNITSILPKVLIPKK